MRNRGAVIFTWKQQREMETGAKEVFITRDRLLPHILEKAEVGDLLWVKEHYWDVKSGPTGLQNVHETVPGSWRLPAIPEHLKPFWHLLRKKPNFDPAGLQKGDSRATLRIMEIRPAGFHCAILMRNVDTFQRRWAA